jgi:hypothetical protein
VLNSEQTIFDECDECDFSYIWDTHIIICEIWLKFNIKIRLHDQFQQTWRETLHNCYKTLSYRIVNFLDRGFVLKTKLLNQGFLLVQFKSSLRKLNGRQHDLVYRYGISVSQMKRDYQRGNQNIRISKKKSNTNLTKNWG